MTELAPHIVIDPATRAGKPIIKGTRLTVDEILGSLAGGMDFADVEREYGLNREQINAVITYAASFLKGEHIETTSPAPQ